VSKETRTKEELVSLGLQSLGRDLRKYVRRAASAKTEHKIRKKVRGWSLSSLWRLSKSERVEVENEIIRRYMEANAKFNSNLQQDIAKKHELPKEEPQGVTAEIGKTSMNLGGKGGP